jgi:DNA-binding response OmpR family regulator
MARILVVEDEDKLRDALRRGLEEEGYEVVAVDDGDVGLARAVGEPFDCVILDLMLPGRDGLEVLRELRGGGDRTPTIVLTARGTLEDRVRGLDCGADDYLPKPFAWDELRARVRACLRRAPSQAGLTLRVGGLELDCVRRRLSRGPRHVELTVREFELLEYLARHKGEVVTRDRLAREVWREPEAALTNVIDVYINYLRKKMERAGEGRLIQTVRGAGDKLQE